MTKQLIITIPSEDFKDTLIDVVTTLIEHLGSLESLTPKLKKALKGLNTVNNYIHTATVNPTGSSTLITVQQGQFVSQLEMKSLIEMFSNTPPDALSGMLQTIHDDMTQDTPMRLLNHFPNSTHTLRQLIEVFSTVKVD